MFRCTPGADELAKGMNDVFKMYDVIRDNAEAYMPLFVSAPAPLNRHRFKQLCVVQKSSEGSNSASQEEDTLYSWEVFLLNVEG